MARVVYKVPRNRVQQAEQETTLPLKKVAAYARVSTDSDEQAVSYEAQVSYYTNYIQAKPNWKFVDVYADEGISGTSMKNRDSFKRMLDDARAGKIDLILTKSISRFARNTVDTLSIIRELKEKGIEVYFEKENIWTLDGKGEVLLTIMSSLAQEESRSISENVKWGIRKRFAEGEHAGVTFSRFLGYDEGYVINEEQAAIVRKIFDMYLDHYSTGQIAEALEAEGLKTVRGSTKWTRSSITTILKNERYKGDVLLQKGYTQDFITKKYVKNDGAVQQYYIKNHHEPIIDPEKFDSVQTLMAHRSTKRSSHVFSGKIYCAECGGRYGRKIWHSNEPIRKEVWQCYEKFKIPHKLSFLKPLKIQEAFLKAANKLLERKEELLPNIKKECEGQLGIEEDKMRILEIEQEQTDIEKQLDELEQKVKKRETRILKQEKLEAKYERLQEELEDLKWKKFQKADRIRQLNKIVEVLERGEPLTEFEDECFRSLVEKIMSGPEGLNFIFFDGTEVLIAA